MKKCAVILAGGIGDYLLGNRHVPHILKRFNLKNVDLISVGVTENGKEKAGNFVKESFPSFYDKVIPFIVSNKNFDPSFSYQYNNFNESQKAICDSYDCVFELTTDSLLSFSYDFPILKSFYNFPTPKFIDKRVFKEKYVLAHFFQREEVGDYVNVPKETAREIVNILSKEYKVICPIYPGNIEINKKNLEGLDCEFYQCELSDLWSLAKYSSICIGVSSSIRLFPAHFGIPSLVICGDEPEFSDKPAFSIRWGIFANKTFPKKVNPELICKVATSIINKPEIALFPGIPSEFSDEILFKKDVKNNNPLYEKFLRFKEKAI